jgi:hypothetical protein
LRICLLAVAFRRCLELFRQRSADAGVAPTGSAAPVPAVPAAVPAGGVVA